MIINRTVPARARTLPGLSLVTGATGFIGRYVVRRLIESASPVRVLVRDPSKLEPGDRERLDVVTGDIRDVAAVTSAVDGVSRIIHLAAVARAWARDDSEFEGVNVHALRALLDAARRMDVNRFVHVSTILTLPPNRAAPLRRPARPTPYESTKYTAERLVESYAAAGGDAVIVHPTRVYGPGPLNDANGVTKAVALFLAGRLRFRLDERGAVSSYVHADDVAAGIIAAASARSPAAHYMLGGQNAPFDYVLDLAARAAGTSRRTIGLPPRLALAFAGLAEASGRLGIRPPITREWVRVLLEDRPADCNAACRDLGYSPRPLEAGIPDTVDWLLRSRYREEQ